MANEARTIQLTLTQRLGLDNIIGEQKGKREDSATLYTVRKKLKMSLEYRKDLVKRQVIIQVGPNSGNVGIDEEAAEQEPKFPLDLESGEVRRLKKLGNEVELTAAMMDWFEPIMEQLEAQVVEKPARPSLVEQSA